MKKLLLAVLLLSGCNTTPSQQQLNQSVNQLVASNSWQSEVIQTEDFAIQSYRAPNKQLESTITVYIEGDGFASHSNQTDPINPTPSNPIALNMALQHADTNVIYLGRPCQYVSGADYKNCQQSYWQDKRYASEVIESMHAALNKLKVEYKARKIQLVAYSGGAAVAALLATQRVDISLLITVAGNIDHQAWTKYHGINSLQGSLNPRHYRNSLARIKQIHFVGSEDKVAPVELVKQFVEPYPTLEHVSIVRIADQQHSCCWNKIWPEILQQYQIR